MTTATRAAAALIAAAVLAAPAAVPARDPLSTFDTAPRKEGETVENLPNGRAPDAPDDTDAGTGKGRRSPWYIGFGLGTGGGNVSGQGDSFSFEDLQGGTTSPTEVFINFKIGATLSPGVLVGFDGHAIRSQADQGAYSTAVQISQYDAMVTWFPLGEGFFLRGGAGITRLTFEVDAGSYGSASTEYSGVNALAGAGVALWLGQSFNLTLNADYSIQSYGSSDTDPEASNFFAFWVGFDWY